jgi:Lrp/AsnC family leucine-responsive transcriptional regulator
MEKSEEKSPALDSTDLEIIEALSADGRMSNTKLAERISLSPTACWNRVRALEASGVIAGYAAIVDRSMLGIPDTVIVEITLDRHDATMFERFARELVKLTEVVEAYVVSGEYDYLIKVAVAGTAGYERFMRESLYKLPGVRHTRSIFALRCLKPVPSARR